MTIPTARILVIAVKTLKGGMKEALRKLDTLPGSKMGRCEKCFCKVLLAPSSIELKKDNPGHMFLCYECNDTLPPPPEVFMTGQAVIEGVEILKKARRD